MVELRYEEYVAQLAPEHGDPPADQPHIKERSVSQLAREACDHVGLPLDSNEEILRKKFEGTYPTTPKEERGDYEFLHILRFDFTNDPRLAETELAMCEDFKKIAAILQKYEIPMNLDRVFWRLAGKGPESFPSL